MINYTKEESIALIEALSNAKGAPGFEDEVVNISINNGDFDIYNITDAIREYKGLPIAKSIASENPIVRMFAVMDRRVGKRTLKKLAKEIDLQPPWLQFFYKLRLDSENINYYSKYE